MKESFFVLIFLILPFFVQGQVSYIVYSSSIKEPTTGKSIYVEESTKDDVVEVFGNNYLPISTAGWYRMVYEELGLTFYYVNKADTIQEIYRITINSPAKATTDDGIAILGKTRIAEVIKAYGHTRWLTTTGGEHWTLSYKDLTFSVLKDKSLPEYPFDEMAHIKKPVVKIEIKCDNPDHEYYLMHN